MKKEDLRPVEFRRPESFFRKINENDLKETLSSHIKGWFHEWEKNVSEDRDETVYGIVESETGSIHKVISYDVKFTDRNNKEKDYGTL